MGFQAAGDRVHRQIAHGLDQVDAIAKDALGRGLVGSGRTGDQ